MGIETQKKFQSCFECKAKFKQTSTRYYCCSEDEVFCLRCQNNFCKKCKKTHYKELRLISCPICKWAWNEETAFFDSQQNEHICLQCVRISYAKAREEDNKKVKLIDKPLLVISYEKEQIECYLKRYCWGCNEKLPSQNAEKFNISQNIKDLFCIFCYKKEEEKQNFETLNYLKEKAKEVRNKFPVMTYSSNSSAYSSPTISCNACGLMIFGNKGFITDDFILCESCVNMSALAEQGKFKYEPMKKKNYMMQEDIMEPRMEEDIMEERRWDDEMQKKYEDYEEYQKYNDQNYDFEAHNVEEEMVEKKQNSKQTLDLDGDQQKNEVKEDQIK